jgi:hypothetical protein
MVCNRIRLYSEELLAPRPTLKLGDRLFSAVHDRLFNIFATTSYVGGQTCHAVVAGTCLSQNKLTLSGINSSLSLSTELLSLYSKKKH